jgi:hypothetical protein
MARNAARRLRQTLRDCATVFVRYASCVMRVRHARVAPHRATAFREGSGASKTRRPQPGPRLLHPKARRYRHQAI